MDRHKLLLDDSSISSTSSSSSSSCAMSIGFETTPSSRGSLFLPKEDSATQHFYGALVIVKPGINNVHSLQADRPGYGTGSIFDSTMNLVNAMMGSGIIGLPLALALCGFWPGLLCSVLEAGLTCMAMHILVLCGVRTGQYTLADLCLACPWLGGRFGVHAINLLLIFHTAGTAISYYICKFRSPQRKTMGSIWIACSAGWYATRLDIASYSSHGSSDTCRCELWPLVCTFSNWGRGGVISLTLSKLIGYVYLEFATLFTTIHGSARKMVYTWRYASSIGHLRCCCPSTSLRTAFGSDTSWLVVIEHQLLMVWLFPRCGDPGTLVRMLSERVWDLPQPARSTSFSILASQRMVHCHQFHHQHVLCRTRLPLLW